MSTNTQHDFIYLWLAAVKIVGIFYQLTGIQNRGAPGAGWDAKYARMAKGCIEGMVT